MKREIKSTNERFIFRLEDVFYSLIAVFTGLIWIFVLNVFKKIFKDGFQMGVTVFLVLLLCGIVVSFGLIWHSYQLRKKETYFIEDESISKCQNGQQVFKIPMKEVISVRINNKRGSRGTIILFTKKESLNYFFSYLPINMFVPLTLFGLTSQKMNLIADRKFVVTEIYKQNPKLNIIESS